MNWVGGARKRVTLQGEKRLQKEFFERKRLQPKPRNQFRGSSAVKNGAVSRDLLALQTVSRIQYSDKDISKPVRKIDLDRFKSTVCGRKHNEVELPPSPNEIPSMISLFEQGCSSNTAGTYNRPNSATFVLPSCFSKSSSLYPRITSGSEYDSSSSLSGQSHLSSVRWQGNDRHFPHKHMSSQHKISYSNKKSFDPFDEDFVRFSKNIRPVPDSLKYEKPFIISHESKCEKSDPTKCDNKTSYKHTIAPTQKQDNLHKMTFDPWVVEDFSATPLVRYDSGHKKAGRFPGGDAYKSLTDRGYVSEQSKTTSSHRHKLQCKVDGWSSDKGHDNHSLQSCGLLLDQGTATESNDVYDGYIENRFRDFRPNNEMGKRKKLRKSQETFPFVKLEKSCFDMESRKSKTMRPSPSPPPSLARQNLVDIFNKKDTKTTFSESTDFKRNAIIPRESYGSQLLTDYDLILSSGINGDRKTAYACEVGSPQKGEVLQSPSLPYLEEERSFKGEHRDPKPPIPSAESSTSSCSQAKHYSIHGPSIQDELSDFDWESHCSSAVSAGNQATKKDRFKTSRISEIFEEMRQLENESEDETHAQEDGNPNTAVTPTGKLQSKRQEDDVDGMSEDQLVVSQLLQELVHKVVLQDSQTITDSFNSRFAVPSKAIASAPWKSYKSIYTHTARTEKGRLHMLRQKPMMCHNISSQNVTALVYASYPNHSVTDSGTAKSSEQVVTCLPSPVEDWNKLDLISPVKTALLTHSSATSSVQPRAMEGELLSVYDGLITPPKTAHVNKPKSRGIIEKGSPETPVAWNEPILLEIPTGNIIRDETPEHSLKGIHVENNHNKPETSVRCSSSSSTTPVTGMKYRKQMPHSSDFAEMIPRNNSKKTCDSCTQTDCTFTCDFATSPVTFPSSSKCEAGTQYDIEHDLVMVNDVEMTMEQGDSMELMDCVVQMDVVLADKQWTIRDTILDTGSQTDDVPKYSLRSRKKSSFPDIM